jgi:hypothetical protein
LSYAVSYLFIAIVWLNHHHLFGDAEVAAPRLLWFNFAHLFSASLIPFATEWIAESSFVTIGVFRRGGPDRPQMAGQGRGLSRPVTTCRDEQPRRTACGRAC